MEHKKFLKKSSGARPEFFLYGLCCAKAYNFLKNAKFSKNLK